MIATQVARIIANFYLFLELSDNDRVDLDDAVEAMEVLATDIEALAKPFLRELVDAFEVIASEYSGEAEKLVRDIPFAFYLEEELAADDPVRLAELEAIREARPM